MRHERRHKKELRGVASYPKEAHTVMNTNEVAKKSFPLLLYDIRNKQGPDVDAFILDDA